jgi:hypothetical protein
LAWLAPAQRAAGASLFGTAVIGLPDGARLTPDAAPGAVLLDLDPRMPEAPSFRAGGAAGAALSPDGRTLAVLTSGYNCVYDDEGKRVDSASGQHVLLYDVSAGPPRAIDVAHVPNAFGGIAFDPLSSARLFLGGGPDDVVHELMLAGREPAGWREAREPMGARALDRRRPGWARGQGRPFRGWRRLGAVGRSARGCEPR